MVRLSEFDPKDLFKLSTAFEFEIFQAGIKLKRALKMKVQPIEETKKPNE
jgi:hypothetical protein